MAAIPTGLMGAIRARRILMVVRDTPPAVDIIRSVFPDLTVYRANLIVSRALLC